MGSTLDFVDVVCDRFSKIADKTDEFLKKSSNIDKLLKFVGSVCNAISVLDPDKCPTAGKVKDLVGGARSFTGFLNVLQKPASIIRNVEDVSTVLSSGEKVARFGKGGKVFYERATGFCDKVCVVVASCFRTLSDISYALAFAGPAQLNFIKKSFCEVNIGRVGEQVASTFRHLTFVKDITGFVSKIFDSIHVVFAYVESERGDPTATPLKFCVKIVSCTLEIGAGAADIVSDVTSIFCKGSSPFAIVGAISTLASATLGLTKVVWEAATC